MATGQDTERTYNGVYWSGIHKILFRFAFLFFSLFAITLPFEYNNALDWVRIPFWLPFEGVADWVYSGDNPYQQISISSDSEALYMFVLGVSILAMVVAGVWTLLDRKRPHYRNLLKGLVAGVSYFVALHLLIYGFNKVFKWQFYDAEPNTLFTPAGMLSKDIFYWTSMGSSWLYSFFGGMVEVLTALLLLFRRTRMAGALLGIFVMANIVAINFGFDISVKIHSLFLLLCCLLVIAPDAWMLFRFFWTGDSFAENSLLRQPLFSGKKYAFVKSAIVSLMFFYTLSPYFSYPNFNDDNSPRPPYHGAWRVSEFVLNGDTLPPLITDVHRWRRMFIHRQGYFIVQGMDDSMQDYNYRFNSSPLQFRVYDPEAVMDEFFDEYCSLDCRHYNELSIQPMNELHSLIRLRGQWKGDSVEISLRKIDIDKLPLRQDGFRWTVESYREGE